MVCGLVQAVKKGLHSVAANHRDIRLFFIGKSCFLLGFFGFWGGFLGMVYFLLKKVDLLSRVGYIC